MRHFITTGMLFLRVGFVCLLAHSLISAGAVIAEESTTAGSWSTDSGAGPFLVKRFRHMPENAQRWFLTGFTRDLLGRVPDRYLGKEFIDTYIDEFVRGYLEYFDPPTLPPEVILVANKEARRVHLFDLAPRSAAEEGPKPVLLRTYKVAIGKHHGTHRTSTGLNPDEMVTPEGIFWVDDMVNEPVGKYRNGPDLGPRVISLRAPGKRSPYDDVALHGSKPKVQWTIGKARTYGCLRMYNEEVIELYNLMSDTPSGGIGVLVIITP